MWQAAQWSLPTSVSSGRTVRVRLSLGTSAYGQRGLKAQPEGTLISEGGEP